MLRVNFLLETVLQLGTVMLGSPVILTLKMLRQEDHEFWASPGKTLFKNKKKEEEEFKDSYVLE
jgi:hypothetical protein